ncbi:MAG: pyrroline-5-carboxylate reductase [Tissierellia bacterium]|nr:pyrroline-5-carboxylate reductase [Tissierellia bacterium]
MKTGEKFTGTVGFLGFGNMAMAIADGLLLTGFDASRLWASARDPEKLSENTLARGIHAAGDNGELVAKSDLVVVAVKPHLVRSVLEPLREELRGKVLVSLAVGLSLADYDFLEGVEVLITLPNTPMAAAKGTLIVSEEHSLTAASLEGVLALFEGISRPVMVPKDEMSVAGTLTGCGPAFAAMFLEALGDGAVRYGLSRKLAYELAAAMLEGTAALHLQKGTHPGAMKDAVTSPGGTTIRGVAALEAANFRHAVISAMDAIEGKNA